MVGLDESEVLVLSRGYVPFHGNWIGFKRKRLVPSSLLFSSSFSYFPSNHDIPPPPSPFECFFPIAQWTLSAVVVLLARC